MKHPESGPGDWTLDSVVYEGSPGEIAVAMLSDGQRSMLALRWCEGNQNVEPWPGGGTGWFLLPFTFASAIGRSLAQLHAAGSVPINESGFSRMVKWLADSEGIDDALQY